jgi:predicted RNase H-like HicB family nuclease
MRTSKMLIKGDKVINVSVPVYFFRVSNDKYIHAQCSPLGIVTSGITLEKAKLMFKEAFELWTEYVNERGNIKEVLKELGWKLTRAAAIPKEEPIDVPIELLASRMVSLEISQSRLN